MKKLLVTMMGASLLMSFGEVKEQKKVDLKTVYQAGLAHKSAGNYDKAEACLKAVLKAKPNHGNANFHIRQLDSLRAAARNRLSAKQLKGVVIPEFNMEEMPLNEVIEALGIVVDNNNGEERGAPNIVLNDPAGKIKDKEITINMKNIPAENLLKHMLGLASARVSYGEHTITVLPID